MFRAGLLLIIRRINSVQTAIGICQDPASSQSTQRMTIPIAVYTELILLMMSSKTARNMQRLIIEIN